MFEDTKESNPLKQSRGKPINGTGEAKKNQIQSWHEQQRH